VIEIRSGARRWWNTDERLTIANLARRPTMAKRNSMSTARRSRNRKQEPIPQSGNPVATEGIGDPAPGWVPGSSPVAVATIISDERNRLMKAQAVLGCVAFALLYEDWLEKPNRPSFADAVAAVQDLVNETVDRLGHA
jgi:hypothetical protein